MSVPWCPATMAWLMASPGPDHLLELPLRHLDLRSLRVLDRDGDAPGDRGG
ncbi:MAG: hypothetical protein WB493_13145 [Anaeromyxobacteraceae bacterium]